MRAAPNFMVAATLSQQRTTVLFENVADLLAVAPSSARADLYLRVRGQLDGHINLTRASAGFEQVLNGAPHLLDERVEALGLDIKPGQAALGHVPDARVGIAGRSNGDFHARYIDAPAGTVTGRILPRSRPHRQPKAERGHGERCRERRCQELAEAQSAGG